MILKEMLKKAVSKTKSILVWVSFIVLIGAGLFTWHTYTLYKNLAQERRKVVYEIYGLYNEGADAMQDALLKTCIGDVKEFGSYARAERGKQ